MIKELDFETYLFISKNKLEIFLLDKTNFKNLYNEELVDNKNSNFKNFDNLLSFLDQNFFKIEKLMGSFIKNVILIVENDKNLQVNISLKKKNYEKKIDQNFLENSLIELKDLFNANYLDYKIMHMVIVNEKIYSSLDSNSSSEHLCLEVNFISIERNLVFVLDKILKKYQTQVSQYMCSDYIINFFTEDNKKLSEMASRIKDGLNNNEVILVPKDLKNKGFFEKFFQLFS